MAETMQFDLVSPERRLLSGPANAVQLPGAEGDMTALPDHAPTITTLRPGLVKVDLADGMQEFAVTGGFAEINAEGTTVLAEEALPRADVTQDYLEGLVAQASAAHKEAGPDKIDTAAKQVADLVALGGELGFSLAQPAT